VHLEEAIVPVRLARKQTLELEFGGAVAKRFKGCVGFRDNFLVALRLAEFDQLELIGKLAFDFATRIDRGFEPRTFLEDFLGLVRLVPKRRVFGFLGQRR